MNDWRSGQGYRHDVITIRVIWVAFALSLLVHVAALWTSPPLMRSLAFDPSERVEPARMLVARLAPRVSPTESSPPLTLPSPPPQASPPPRRRAPRPPVTAPAPSPPPSVARSEPAPGPAPTPPAPPRPQAEAPAGPPLPGDLTAYIAARRRARGETTAPGAQGNAPNAPPVESEQERLNRVVAANLGLNRTPTFGSDPKRGGGMFELRRIGSDDAEFYFNGWNQEIGRVARQLIEVRKGANADIRVAVIRRIIDIIRAQEPGDFIWVSRRLGRQVALSARPADNAGLEEFMMREFFGDGRAP
jgi:hypothetical protein